MPFETFCSSTLKVKVTLEGQMIIPYPLPSVYSAVWCFIFFVIQQFVIVN